MSADLTGAGRLTAEHLEGLLPDEVEVELEAVEARRRRIFVVGGIAAIGSAAIAAMLLLIDGVDLPWWVGWALVATTALFLADAVQQERVLAKLTRTLVAQQRREAQLETTVHDLGGLLDTSRRVNGVLLPEEIYDVILDAAVALLGAPSGTIRVRDGAHLAVAASAGPNAPSVGSTSEVDDAADTRHDGDGAPRLALPMMVGDQYLGVLEVHRDADSQEFSQRLALLGRLFAELAAGAVANANRFDLERSRAEELQTDRQVRTDAVADTVHDMRTPLSGLLGMAELLQLRHDRMADEQRLEAIDGMVHTARQLQRLIDQVFEVAAAEAQATRRRERVELEPLVGVTAAAAAASAGSDGVEVSVVGAPVVLGDAGALRRIVSNLVANALEHGSSDVEVRVLADSETVTMHVNDHGPGIPTDQLDALFQRRSRPDGSPRGRGLGIVDTLVRAMGGSVGVRSRIGIGSVFTVKLPAADDAGWGEGPSDDLDRTRPQASADR